jgi:hypothetical protein
MAEWPGTGRRLPNKEGKSVFQSIGLALMQFEGEIIAVGAQWGWEITSYRVSENPSASNLIRNFRPGKHY